MLVKREEGSKYKGDAKNESVAPEEKEITPRMQKMTNFFIVNISMRKMILEVEFSKSMIYEILKIFRGITYISSRDDPKTFILL